MTDHLTDKLQRRVARALRGARPSGPPAGSGLHVEPADGARLRETLSRNLHKYNLETTGIREVWPFAFQVRDPSGAVVGGVSGWIWGGTSTIEFLWVAGQCRGRGLGSRLVAEVERLARAHGCHQIGVDTFSFQGPGFYAALGFETIGELTESPRGHSMLHLRKRLATV